MEQWKDFEHVDDIATFWENVNKYAIDNTLINEIEKVFPKYFVDNYEQYQDMLDKTANIYYEQYLSTFGEEVDFSIKYYDAFKYIVYNMKQIVKETGTIRKSDIDFIIVNMYTEKIKNHEKQQQITGIVETLEKIAKIKKEV